MFRLLTLSTVNNSWALAKQVYWTKLPTFPYALTRLASFPFCCLVSELHAQSVCNCNCSTLHEMLPPADLTQQGMISRMVHIRHFHCHPEKPAAVTEAWSWSYIWNILLASQILSNACYTKKQQYSCCRTETSRRPNLSYFRTGKDAVSEE